MSKENDPDSPKRFVTVLQSCLLITVALAGVFFASWLGDRILAIVIILPAVLMMMVPPDASRIASDIGAGIAVLGCITGVAIFGMRAGFYQKHSYSMAAIVAICAVVGMLATWLAGCSIMQFFNEPEDDHPED